jgi:hypothetical protein
MIEMPEHDRKRILEVHQAYLNANASYDWQALRPIWSDDPTNVCFAPRPARPRRPAAGRVRRAGGGRRAGRPVDPLVRGKSATLP